MEDKKNTLLLRQEIKLAKILAGNNKTLRERTLKRLKKFLDDRTLASPFNDDVFMRIWKGLFYYMWMSDKLLVQEECAERLAQLVHFKDAKISLAFFKCFLKTMVQEWFGIDHHRYDKFLMLVRRVLRQAFYVLKQVSWDTEHIDMFKEILNETVLKAESTVAIGLTIHMTDIYLEELAKVSEGNLSNDSIIVLLQPFAQLLARTEDERITSYIRKNIFRYLMTQSELGIEYQEKFAAWKRAGFPGGHINKMQKIETGEKDENNEIMDNEDGELKDRPLDPRAGKVNVDLPQLKFDSADVVKMLEDLMYKKYTTSISRNVLRKLNKEFKKMSAGEFPIAVKKVPTINATDYKLNVKSAVKRLEEFQSSIKEKSSKKERKQIKKNKLKESTDEAYDDENDENTGRVDKNEDDFDAFVARSEAGIFDENIDMLSDEIIQNKSVKETKKKVNGIAVTNGKVGKNKNNKMKKQRTQLQEVKNISNGTAHIENKFKNSFGKDSLKSFTPGVLKIENNAIPKNTKKNEGLNKRKQSLDGEYLQPITKRLKSGNTIAASTQNQIHKIRKVHKNVRENMFVRNSGVWHVDDLLERAKLKQKSKLKSKKSNETKSKNDKIDEWSKPLQEFETELNVMSKKTKQKLKKSGSETPPFKKVLINPYSLKNSFSPSSPKKIKFALNLNESQEVHEHHAKVSESPNIPYDAAKKPVKPLLKPSFFSSPINPFYKKKSV